jgi:hypothetical protein
MSWMNGMWGAQVGLRRKQGWVCFLISGPFESHVMDILEEMDMLG